MSSLAGRDAGLGAQGYVGQVVRAPKTAELIATLYRRQIVRGELRPGDTLPIKVHFTSSDSSRCCPGRRCARRSASWRPRT